MDLISLAILILCLAVLLIYLRTKKYDSPAGLIMLFLSLAAILLKLYFRGNSPNLFNPSLFLASGLIVMGTTLLFCLILIPLRKNRFRLGYALTLLPLYIFFGFLQQLLFQYLFLESAFSLIGSFWPSLIIGALFYLLFHLNLDFDAKFKVCLFLVDIFWGYCYLTYHNIFWLALSHGIIGAVYYSLIVHQDAIRHRLSEKTVRIMPKY